MYDAVARGWLLVSNFNRCGPPKAWAKQQGHAACGRQSSTDNHPAAAMKDKEEAHGGSSKMPRRTC
ncbi:hypothetical protein PC129_g10179 [Phytophthora cactorum]|uniref:Uncharacterized protein n=1 Tax=Phytophthora cactorum TaxID=29920 RepID=A0A8T1LL07_9STRA|nr:hypothetical protein Pcac1_g24099 [Phytophthora cactorum]KAG2832060.1 hypothetical protein PC112_g7042 [Phytophthora cactorum]KAG2847043.1 hypothetical protein PC111_g1002 [Phytophthora cactorum]KAG2861300.1 hypothetical protein PC113_g7286 [Phytophthora cactorum]KAG2916584.1 hypothetical protein PC115_g10989 [Phytophthora cactorum]